MFGDLIPLAVTLQSAKGCMALLVGSGISRASGIPTGWEITIELTRRVAAADGQDPGADPVQWYRSKYGADPDYADLLGRLAETSAARQTLLRPFFEPSEQDRDAGLKKPSAAHRAIADLVQSGAIRVIITTNFDRLLERALQDVGIAPTVISNDDNHKGAAPLPHSPCTIVKVHGDYLDTRLKNSVAELSSYDPGISTLLSRIFSDYGLIVSGWSAEYDIALRQAIETAPAPPYPTYWLSRGAPGTAAQALIDRRKALVVQIDGAEKFLPDLAARVKALDDLAGQSPVTVKSAVATAKRLMAEDRFEIRLHDFLMEQFNAAVNAAEHEGLISGSGPRDIAGFRGRLGRLEHLLEIPCSLLAAGAYWQDNNAAFAAGLKIFWDLAPNVAGAHELLSLTVYPATLAFYAVGVAETLRGRYQLLPWALTYAETHPRQWPHAVSRELHVDAILPSSTMPFYEVISSSDAKQRLDEAAVPLGSSRIFRILKPILSEYAANETTLTWAFDRFEVLISLLHADLRLRLEKEGRRSVLWVPDGLYAYRQAMHFGGHVFGLRPNGNAVAELSRELESMGNDFPPIRAGLFGGDPSEAKAAIEFLKAYYQQRGISF